MRINDYSYEDIGVGDVFEFKKVLTLEDVDSFAGLTGDLNPLHCDEAYASRSPFKKRISHGMLAASLFSTLVGMLCPGRRSLYLSQMLDFRRPIYPGTELTVLGKVIGKVDSVKIVVIETTILESGEEMITGEAKVRVLGD